MDAMDKLNKLLDMVREKSGVHTLQKGELMSFILDNETILKSIVASVTSDNE